MTALARTDCANFAAVVGIAAGALEPTRSGWAGTALDRYRSAPGGLVIGGTGHWPDDWPTSPIPRAAPIALEADAAEALEALQVPPPCGLVHVPDIDVPRTLPLYFAPTLTAPNLIFPFRTLPPML